MHIWSTLPDCHRDPIHAPTTFCLPIPKNGHFQCLYLATTQNNAAMSSLMYDPSWTHVAISVDNLSSMGKSLGSPTTSHVLEWL